MIEDCRRGSARGGFWDMVNLSPENTGREISADGGPASGWPRRPRIEIVLAALSFLIYSATVFVLPQNRVAVLNVERSSVAAAVSNVVYHARFGRIYSDVLDQFLATAGAPLQPVLDHVAQTNGPHGTLLKTTADGNGVGYLVVATAALRLFDLHVWALPLVMIGLMCLSMAVFLWRFYDRYAGVVTLYFTALTLMLFTLLVWDPAWATQIGIGGIRYFCLVAILPAFHIVFELMDRPVAGSGRMRRNALLLGAQAAIFAFAVLVRASAGVLIGAFVVVGLILAWQGRRNANKLRLLRSKSAIVALTGAGLLAVVIVSIPHDYLRDGRFTTVFWHRVLISLDCNPEWPSGFGNVRETYDCEKYIPGGLQAGANDRNGACIWWAYIIKHHLPTQEAGPKVYGGLYEKAMREAFINIAEHYPSQVLITFLYYKPRYIVSAIGQMTNINIKSYPLIARLLLAGALINLTLYLWFGQMRLQYAARIGSVVLLFFAFGTIPSIVAWANPSTIPELPLYCIFMIGLGLAMLPMAAQAILLRRRAIAAGDTAAEGGFRRRGDQRLPQPSGVKSMATKETTIGRMS
jgi:hypothetical protein